jgi:fucose 4-O-acetylase-like acetyltransferase
VIGGAGVLCCAVALLLDHAPIRLYAVYDYWHTSPLFLLLRCGILLLIMFAAYAWCAWGLARNGLSPAIQLGKTSLLVYWVHIEFVYGRLSILPKHKCTVLQATVGLCIIFLAMLVLSLVRTNWKSRHSEAQTQAATSTPAAAPSLASK